MANDRPQGTAVFPAGLVLQLDAKGVVLGNQGDVVIEGDLAASLGAIKHVFSQSGSLEISAASFEAESIEAPEGEIRMRGNVKANAVKAKTIRHTDGKIQAKVIIAETEIELTGKSVKAEVVVAPKVTFGADTKGRATAVECENALGSSKVRGRLSLIDYVEIVSGAEDVLADNDIPIPVADDDDEEDDDEEPPAAPEAVDDLVEEPPGEDAEAEIEVEDSDAAEIEVEEAEAAAEEEDEIHLAAEESEEAGEPSGLDPEVEAELTEQLTTALTSIAESYTQDEVPPPVVFLQSLVDERRFDYIKMQINSIWSDLLKYHQKKGLYISNTVTHQFQQIQLAMRRIPDA